MSNKQSRRLTLAFLETRAPGSGQSGGLTIFTGIFVLVLMTLMLLYATRVGIFEQRISANEARQKVAFHAAEAAIDQAQEYVRANTPRLFRASAQAMPDGDGGFRPGWFADGVSPGWQECTVALIAMANHPCGGRIPAASGSFFYGDPDDLFDVDAYSLPINMGALPGSDTTTARVSMTMCIVDVDDPTGACLGAPESEEDERTAVGMVQLMGYGFTDCTDTDDLDTCTAEARIARPLANYKTLNGKPQTPLTTKSPFPPQGTAEVVPNPNAGGVGVPVSVWANNNLSCGTPPAVTGQGSWSTCELHEWYGRDVRPDEVACDITPCRCHKDEALSYTQGQETHKDIDILADDNFPCDLFEYYFGVPRAQYQLVKDTATVINDCTGLGPQSHGLYWVSGSTCRINANTVVGSPENPIILVSAAQTTSLRGGAQIFGVLYVFDGEHANATLRSAGTTTIYGTAVVDAEMGQYTGTFQVVYSDVVLANAAAANGLGHVPGGWRDFGLPQWTGVSP